MKTATQRSGESQGAPATSGLILTGGGARAAYQVGVLAALAERLPADAGNPFPVISGASAGSINALLMASRAGNFQQAVADMSRLWSNLTVDKVYRIDTPTMLKTSARWLAWFTFLRAQRFAPAALLDNSPLRKMLETHCPLAHVQKSLDRGELQAIAVTAASYTTARSTTFFQGALGTLSWSRTRRDGVMTNLSLDHLMASIALPIIFPATRIGDEYYGDGSMRQAAPLSPAIHLGADQLLVIGMRNEDARKRNPPGVSPDYPSFGEIGGYILDSLFMDSLYADIERLRRINELVRQLGHAAQHGVTPLREIDVTVIVPSEDIRDIAQRHARRMPRTLKTMFRLLGATRSRGSQLTSYLLFDGEYCRELIELGYQDGLRHRDALAPFVESTARQSR